PTRVKRDRGSGALIIFTVLVSIIIALSLGYAGVGPLPDWVFYPGIFLMLLGVVVRQWAIAVLGRFFSLTVRVAEDHRVVVKGPYRLVRHPSYTGVLITFIGLALGVQSSGALLVLFAVFVCCFGWCGVVLGAFSVCDVCSWLLGRVAVCHFVLESPLSPV